MIFHSFTSIHIARNCVSRVQRIISLKANSFLGNYIRDLLLAFVSLLIAEKVNFYISFSRRNDNPSRSLLAHPPLPVSIGRTLRFKGEHSILKSARLAISFVSLSEGRTGGERSRRRSKLLLLEADCACNFRDMTTRKTIVVQL